MKETINDLWRGRIHPYNDFAQKMLIEKELKRFLDEHREDFLGQLDEKGKRLFFDFFDSIDKIWMEACENSFEEGFSIGMKLTIESLK